MSSTPSLPNPAPLDPSAETPEAAAAPGIESTSPEAGDSPEAAATVEPEALQASGDEAAETPAAAATEAVDADATKGEEAPAEDAAPAAAGAKPAPVAMSPAECAQALKSRFPALFAGAPKPLKLRIQADIQARAPGVFTRQSLSAFLRRHTGSTSYLIALSRAKTRFDLDGQPADELSDEHRQAAVDELTRRRGVTQQRREAEDQQRRDRFNLLRDFEHTTLTEPNFCALKGLTPEQLHATLAQARQELTEAPPQREFDRRPPRDGQFRDDRRPGGGGPRGPGGPGPRGDGRGPGRGDGPRADGPRADGPRGDGPPPRREGGGPRRDGAGARGPRNSGPRRHDDRPQGPRGPAGGKPPGSEGGGNAA
ncbi:ProQ/FinO family protein [Ideonella azotifigens]|uniref:ProQ/FinO domain-containing protein n=2 Tax=Ideonella azotifigens TaxID=513160 RepID=A0ABP3VE24_9BURK|nr:ProQ/FinO family protein [Ideonella azotifigens]MCD2342414.1 ProQ/FinO family protein [Ideonella azotifigens]